MSLWDIGYFRRTLPDIEVKVEIWESVFVELKTAATLTG